ncbi:MAG: IS200/IS605 family transposase [Acidobacteria bacterium]|nr:MAG: IS200/IS605 family transposase [Acidobacteriota bacterium]
MPSTHTILLYHLIFAAKERYPFISDSWAPDRHAFLGGCVCSLDGVPLEIGGSRDHAHLLLSLKPTHRLSDVVMEVKRGSSRWLHDERISPTFTWQEGYGCATVSPSQRERVRRYILNQAEHHRRRTFQEEYVDFLKKNGVEYDERYIW